MELGALEEVKGVVTILLFILLHPRVNDAFSKGEEETFQGKPIDSFGKEKLMHLAQKRKSSA